MDSASTAQQPVFDLPFSETRNRASAVRRYGVTLLAVAAMSAFRVSLTPVIGHASPFLLFTPAVMLAAWYGGLWPGVVATLLSTVVGAQFLRPSSRVAIEEWDRVALFVAVGMALTWLQVTAASATGRIRLLLAREQAARAEAEAANSAKDDFLARVSHELCGPLGVVIGWTSLLRDHAMDPASVRKAADVIEHNARTQERLVGDIVDSVRAARGTMRLERGRVDLASLVAAVVEAIRPTAERRGVAVQATIPPGESAVWADATRLHQVLMNLLTNAVKFNRPGGAIIVCLERAEGRARIAVSDTGAGIDAELLPHVFEPFKKGRESTPGLGLGLSIVRHLIEMHGGQVAVASAGRSQGSTFTVTLPLMTPREPASAAPLSSDSTFHAIRRPS
jgi:signal transduction histidine kinase